MIGPWRRVHGGALALVLALGVPVEGASQALEELSATCAQADPALLPWCQDGALAYQAATGGLGLLTSQGSDIPGYASTVGRRLGATPRLSLSVRFAGLGLARPDLVGSTASPAPEASGFTAALQAGAAVGLFDGFSAAPTLGGILSIDALAFLGAVFPPDDVDGGTTTYGIGVRIGILRESFTVPGISVSLARYWRGEVTVGGAGLQQQQPPGDRGGSPAAPAAAPGEVVVDFDGTVTSIRGLVGKDLLVVGALFGVGWDRYRDDLTLQVRPGSLGGATGGATAEGFTTDRFLAFGSVSWSYLVFQFTGELGWAQGLDDIFGRGSRAYDPSAGTLFGNLSARLTI